MRFYYPFNAPLLLFIPLLFISRPTYSVPPPLKAKQVTGYIDITLTDSELGKFSQYGDIDILGGDLLSIDLIGDAHHQNSTIFNADKGNKITYSMTVDSTKKQSYVANFVLTAHIKQTRNEPIKVKLHAAKISGLYGINSHYDFSSHNRATLNDSSTLNVRLKLIKQHNKVGSSEASQ